MAIKAMLIPSIGEYVQGIDGHWYKVLEVLRRGQWYQVDQVYVTHNSETGDTRMRSYGYAPIAMGRSDFQFGQD
jgi:hypothetical protein